MGRYQRLILDLRISLKRRILSCKEGSSLILRFLQKSSLSLRQRRLKRESLLFKSSWKGFLTIAQLPIWKKSKKYLAYHMLRRLFFKEYPRKLKKSQYYFQIYKRLRCWSLFTRVKFVILSIWSVNRWEWKVAINSKSLKFVIKIIPWKNCFMMRNPWKKFTINKNKVHLQ